MTVSDRMMTFYFNQNSVPTKEKLKCFKILNNECKIDDILLPRVEKLKCL